MTPGTGAVPVIRELTADDTSLLESFACRSYRQPWTIPIEEMIRERLPHAVANQDEITVVGLFVGDELCAVTAWRIDEEETGLECRSIVLAVRIGHRRRGFAHRLKRHVLNEARRSGARTVASWVHWENDPMIELNRALGANFFQVDDDPDYALCVIALDATSPKE